MEREGEGERDEGEERARTLSIREPLTASLIARELGGNRGVLDETEGGSSEIERPRSPSELETTERICWLDPAVPRRTELRRRVRRLGPGTLPRRGGTLLRRGPSEA